MVWREILMTKMRGKGVVLAAFAAGVVTYLSKKQNRDNTMNLLNTIKSKTNNKMNFKNFNKENTTLKDMAETAASNNSTSINENEFIGEGGGQTTLAYYNEQQEKS
jgi:hypothetical protein